MKYPTIPELVYSTCDKYKDTKSAFLYKKDDTIHSINYTQLKQKITCFSLGLLDLGIRHFDRVGLASENRLEWFIAHAGTVSIGAIIVPIFPILTSKQEEYIFNNCEVTAIIVSNKFQLSKIMEFKENLLSLRHVIVMEDDFESEDFGVKSMFDIITRGEEILSTGNRIDNLKEIRQKIQPDDILTLIYTSGTTGDPKGVTLTHNNISSNVSGSLEIIGINENDTFLSYLPWCHAYELSTGLYAAFKSGATIAIAEAIEAVGSNIQEFRPTLMTTVPRLLEMILKKIKLNMEKESATKQKIFHWAIAVGKDYIYRKLDNQKIPITLKTKYSIANKLIFTKIRAKTGGRLKTFVSGGAALPNEVCEFFLAAGYLVLEGYGLTEASPVVSANSPEDIEIGTIGKPLRDVQIKLAEDGEILVKGPNVMIGYWKDTIATEKAIDSDGWLYTGDVGMMTEKENIKITDRKKNIFVSSGGKNIAPQPIESIISQSIFIEQVILVGDNRDFITALITPDFEQLKVLAESLQILYENLDELITNPTIKQVIKNDIDRLQKDFAKFERVRKFRLLSQPFTVENGELTPKMSIKRHVVERKYSLLINEMYGVK